MQESNRICEELLAEEMSPYFRMRVLMLLYSLLEDWMEKESLRTKAEAICASFRGIYPRGMFEVVDATLSAAEEKLEEMAQEQAERGVGPAEEVVFFTDKTRASMMVWPTEAYPLEQANGLLFRLTLMRSTTTIAHCLSRRK